VAHGRRYDPPVPEFLTPEWVAELDALGRRASPRPSGASDPMAETGGSGRPLTVELHVTGTPSGEFVFQAAFGESTLRFASGSPWAPDLLVTLDYLFATRIHLGDANAQDALAAGALKVRGDLELVAASAPALSALGDALAEAFAGLRQSPDA